MVSFYANIALFSQTAGAFVVIRVWEEEPLAFRPLLLKPAHSFIQDTDILQILNCIAFVVN